MTLTSQLKKKLSTEGPAQVLDETRSHTINEWPSQQAQEPDQTAGLPAVDLSQSSPRHHTHM